MEVKKEEEVVVVRKSRGRSEEAATYSRGLPDLPTSTG